MNRSISKAASWFSILASVPALAACDGDEKPSAAAPPADAAPLATAEAPRPRPRASEELIEVDLSDAAVGALSLAELWEIGVQHLGWPAHPPPGASKPEVHQRLLQGKYRDFGDFGGTGYDGGKGYDDDR